MKKKLMILSALLMTTACWASQPLTQLSFVATVTAADTEIIIISVEVNGGVPDYLVQILSADGETVVDFIDGQDDQRLFEFTLGADDYIVQVTDSTGDEGPGTGEPGGVPVLIDQVVSETVSDSDLTIGTPVPTISQLSFFVAVTQANSIPFAFPIPIPVGFISVSVTGGTPDFTVNIITQDGAQSFPGVPGQEQREFLIPVPAGTFDVQVTDSTGGEGTGTGEPKFELDLKDQSPAQTVVVPSCDLTIAKVEVVPVNCIDDENGKITVKVAGGQPNYTVDLCGPADNNSQIQTMTGVGPDFDFPISTAGRFSTRVTDCSFCERIANNIVVPNSVEIDEITVQIDNCLLPPLGPEGKLTVNLVDGEGGFTVVLTEPDGETQMETEDVQSFTFDISQFGTFGIQVTDNANDCMRSASITVAPLTFTTEITPVDGEFGAIKVTVMGGGGPPYRVLVTGPNDFRKEVTGESNQLDFFFSGLVTGFYTVEAADSPAGSNCQDQREVFVPVNDLNLTITTTSQSFAQEMGGTATFSGRGLGDFDLEIINQFGQTIRMQTIDQQASSYTHTFLNLPAGSYTGVVTSPAGVVGIVPFTRMQNFVITSDNDILNFINEKHCSVDS